VVTHISYALHSPLHKLRTLASELLAAICLLSPVEGHKAVLSAMSDYRVMYEESFRFEALIASLRFPVIGGDADAVEGGGVGEEEEGVWEARTAALALVNALIDCPELLEDRILLREEFVRRGLNEIIAVCQLGKNQFCRLILAWSDSTICQTSRLVGDTDRRLRRRET
jgi:diaphanous 1